MTRGQNEREMLELAKELEAEAIAKGDTAKAREWAARAAQHQAVIASFFKS